jgi:hypothetical protein
MGTSLDRVELYILQLSAVEAASTVNPGPLNVEICRWSLCE